MEPETSIEVKLGEIKSEHIKNIDPIEIKVSAITSNKSSSYSEEPTTDIVKLPLLKLTDKYSHASQFNKYLSSLNFEVDTLLQIPKLWDAIRSDYSQSLSTNNWWTT